MVGLARAILVQQANVAVAGLVGVGQIVEHRGLAAHHRLPHAARRIGVNLARSVGQRLGHLLDALGYEDKTGDIHNTIVRGPTLSWVELEPAQAAAADLAPEPIQRDTRWHVVVRRAPEPDE